MYGESNMETYIIICKIYSQWEVALQHRELNLVLCHSLEVWHGIRGESDIQEGGAVCTLTADAC